MTKEKRSKHRSLTWYLNKYIRMQEQIMLVYRPTKQDNWSDRHLFLSDEYIPTKEYNHRSVLRNEIVIEFDYEDPRKNRRLIDKVCANLSRDNIQYSLWTSGNKSYHAHFFINIDNAKNLALLKKTVMRYYTEDVAVPDMRLASDNHLIRAENGVHEKTGRHKKLSYQTHRFPEVSRLPQDVWDKYIHNQKISVSVRTQNYVSSLENHKAFEFIMQSEKFRLSNDGRERGLFVLGNVLRYGKFKDDKEGLIKFLQEWYAYSGGYKITEQQIRHKVNYWLKRSYKIGINYLRELLESIGREDLLE